MRIIVFFIPVFLFAIWGCSDPPPFKGKSDLQGIWHCKTIEITAPSNESIGFSVYKYGYAYFELSKDSLYFYDLEIIKDVVVEKSVFGNPYKKTLIQGGYKNLRKGYYKSSDSLITFYDNNNNKEVSSENYFFSGRVLYTKFKDKEEKTWKISWEKDN